MKSTILLVLLLATWLQLARADELIDGQTEATGGDKKDVDQVGQVEQSADDIMKAVAEQEARLMAKYSHLVPKEQDDKPAIEKETRGNWFSQLFGARQAPRRGATLAADYRRINDELMRRTDNNSVLENMNVAIEWYNAEGKDDEQVGDALGLLVSLAELTGDNQCNLHSERVLRLNKAATQGLKHNRVVDIVHFFIEAHGEECHPIYRQKFKDIMGKLGDDSDVGARGLLKDSYMAEEAGDNHQMMGYMISGSDLDNTDGKAFRESRDKLVGHVFPQLWEKVWKNKKLKKPADKVASISKLVDESLVEPCKRYVDLVGPDVYIPYYFDLSTSDSFYRKELTGEVDVDFSLGYTRFEVCQFVSRQQKELKQQLSEMATKAANV